MAISADDLNKLEKVLEEKGWCGECRWGLIDPPEPSRMLPLAEARLAQYMAGHLRFCQCPMGQSYLRLLKARSEEHVPLEEALRQERLNAEQRRLERLFKEANVPPYLQEWTFKSFVAKAAGDREKEKAIRAIREYHEKGFLPGPDGRPRLGIILYGPSGTGKTGALTPLFVDLVKKGKVGLWISGLDLIGQLREYDTVEERIEFMRNVEVLFIDDWPGLSRFTDYIRDAVIRIAAGRAARENTRTFLTTSMDLKQEPDVHDATFFRYLARTCLPIRMGGRMLSDLEF